MELREFAVDPSTYEDGKRIPLGEGVHVTVRSAGSERATKVRERLWKPYSTFRAVPPEVLDKLNARWIAQALLSEMVGFTIKGQPLTVDLSVEEDQERLATILAAPEYKGFRGKIIGIAIDESNYQASMAAVTEKNSVSSPAGISSGANTQSE